MKRLITSLTLATTTVCLAWCSSSAYGQVDAYNTVINNGDSANRVDMIIIGDGYTEAQLSTDYIDHVNGTVNHFFNNASSSPLNRYKNFFNVHRVNVISQESGADKPLDDFYVNTALDASYSWNSSVERCLYFDTGKANAAVANALMGTGIDTDDGLLLGTVNDTQYGGCGGQWGVYSGGNGAAYEVALHEAGHSFAKLADEYFYTEDEWTGGEFSQWNITNNPDSGKWDRWVGYNDPDSDIGEIGYYEGGRYNATGVWRPSDNSKMRALNRPFDAISREKFINDIYAEVDPLDDWFDLEGFTETDELWVSTVDSDVIKVEWFVDGEPVGVLGEVLDIDSLGLAEGTYEFTARAYDEVLDFANTGLSLDWWRLAPEDLEQSVSWTVSVSAAIPEPGSAVVLLGLCGMYALRRRRL